jgi:peptidoglycan hydrolase-like amidase
VTRVLLAVLIAALVGTFGTAAASAAGSPQPATVHITGRVMDGRNVGESTVIPDDLAPIAGATVTGAGRSTSSAADGSFDLAVAQRSTSTEVVVSKAGFGSWHLSGLSAGDDSDLLVQLTGSEQRMTTAPSGSNPAIQQAPPAAASPCSHYYSDKTPPGTIRVALRYSNATSTSGAIYAVRTYNFNFYVKHVLPHEWIASWRPNSLMAGAMAVKTFGWFYVNNWAGGRWGGHCYDVDNSIGYQVFDPNSAAASTNKAVDGTWHYRLLRSGHIFQAHFCEGWDRQPGGFNCAARVDSCAHFTDGQGLSQTGSQDCARRGWGWQRILHAYYYPHISILAT